MIEYREPPFNRVWVSTRPDRKLRTTYGLDKEGRTIECELHWEIDSLEGGREYALRHIAEIVLDKDRHMAQVRYEHSSRASLIAHREQGVRWTPCTDECPDFPHEHIDTENTPRPW